MTKFIKVLLIGVFCLSAAQRAEAFTLSISFLSLSKALGAMKKAAKTERTGSGITAALSGAENIDTDSKVLIKDTTVLLEIMLGTVQGDAVQLAVAQTNTWGQHIDPYWEKMGGRSVVFVNLLEPPGSQETLFISGGSKATGEVQVNEEGQAEGHWEENYVDEGTSQFDHWLSIVEGRNEYDHIAYNSDQLERREWTERNVGIFDDIRYVGGGIEALIEQIYQELKAQAAAEWKEAYLAWKKEVELAQKMDEPVPDFEYENGFRADVYVTYRYEGEFKYSPPSSGGAAAASGSGGGGGGGGGGGSTEGGVAIQCYLTGGTVMSAINMDGDRLANEHFLGNFGSLSSSKGVRPGVTINGKLLRIGEAQIPYGLSSSIQNKVISSDVQYPSKLPPSDGFASPASVIYIRN